MMKIRERSNQTPESSVVQRWMRWPNGWDYIDGFRHHFSFHPVHLLLLSGPFKALFICTVLSLGLPVWISCRGGLSRPLGSWAETGQHLQAWGGGLSMVLVEVVGSLLLMRPGDGAGAGASGALLYRSASMAGMSLVMGTFSMGRGRTGSLVRNWWYGTRILGLKETVFCDAVALRSSGRRVSWRGVDALESRAEV